MIKRRDARELAFILVFEKSFSDVDMSEIIATAELDRDIEPDEYTKRVAYGVYDNLETIDAAISQHSNSRSIMRLSKVVLALLRLALYEIIYIDDIEVSISINEAVELAKKYGGREEPGFINGVLGAYVRARAASDSGETK